MSAAHQVEPASKLIFVFVFLLICREIVAGFVPRPKTVSSADRPVKTEAYSRKRGSRQPEDYPRHEVGIL